MDKLLSERAKVSRDSKDPFYKNLSVCNSNLYDETDNPTGYINLGTAVQNLCDDILHPKLNDVWKCGFDSLGYKDCRGTRRLREAMANFMTEFLESHEPVSPDDLFCLTGLTSCIDLLGHCLGDPGEVFLIPTPIYGRIYTNFMQRSLIEVWPVPVITENDGDSGLTLEKIACAYENAVRADNKVRGIFLINPNNPTGDIYSPKLLMDIMSFCSQKSLHVVVDEVYGLSVFSETEKFHSILKFSHLPDPDKTHVLYGLSKDFGIAGLRVGVIHTKCKQLQKSLIQLSCFQCIPSPIMEVAAAFLEDLEWCRKYITIYRKRLAEKYNACFDYLNIIGVKVRECPAGFFLWVDFRQLSGSSFDGEEKLFNYLLNNARLNINPGQEFFCAQPGWFRIVFTQKIPHLIEGLRRLHIALENYKLSKE